MALASFFDKAALSAGALLQDVDAVAIRTHLMSVVVGLCWDELAAASPEGRHAADLAIDLLARLYPRIALVATASHDPDATRRTDDAPQRTLRERLELRAREINDVIEIEDSPRDVSVWLVLGRTPVPQMDSVADHGQAPIIYYLGSSAWTASISTGGPVGSGPTTNPYGAGVASCLGAAAVFRAVFRNQLTDVAPRSASGVAMPSEIDMAQTSAANDAPPRNTVTLSVLDLLLTRDRLVVPPNDVVGGEAPVDIGEAFLVGAGAIGNAVVWALARTPSLRGMLHVIDGESVDLSNLQRYVLASQHSLGCAKVDVAHGAAVRDRAASSQLGVTRHALTWAAFLRSRGNYNLDRVLLALDSAEDRIAVQASLPRWIANAWTQPDNLGVSRHEFLENGPCVACLYHPTGTRKNKDQLYAESLGCATNDELMEVRVLLHNGKPVGRNFIERVALRLGIDHVELLRFEHASLDEFYVGALCGGIVFRLGGGLAMGRPAEVPMAFQSALAGILLAAELVIDAGGLREAPLPARTEVDLLRLRVEDGPLLRLNTPATKHPSGRCICQDDVYRRAYSAKHAVDRQNGPRAEI
jgi:hypothetical protein